MNQVYQCPVCGLHYYEEKYAKDCKVFCKQYHGCSLEITQHSVEHQRFLESQKRHAQGAKDES